MTASRRNLSRTSYSSSSYFSRRWRSFRDAICYPSSCISPDCESEAFLSVSLQSVNSCLIFSMRVSYSLLIASWSWACMWRIRATWTSVSLLIRSCVSTLAWYASDSTERARCKSSCTSLNLFYRHFISHASLSAFDTNSSIFLSRVLT